LNIVRQVNLIIVNSVLRYETKLKWETPLVNCFWPIEYKQW
jgi:hypothetical protein